VAEPFDPNFAEPRPKKWRVIVAAAVAIAITVAWAAQFGERAVPKPPNAQPVTETLTLIAPLDRVSAPFEFQWASRVPNAAYRIEVFDTAGTPVAARVVRTDRIAADDLLGADRARVAQSYTWKVTVFDDKGIFVASSPSRPFEVR
jgi:hypothetical protein